MDNITPELINKMRRNSIRNTWRIRNLYINGIYTEVSLILFMTMMLSSILIICEINIDNSIFNPVLQSTLIPLWGCFIFLSISKDIRKDIKRINQCEKDILQDLDTPVEISQWRMDKWDAKFLKGVIDKKPWYKNIFV